MANAKLLGVLPAVFGLGSCASEECAPSAEVCGRDADSDVDSDVDADADTSTDTCDFQTWDPADDTCVDATTAVTCGDDGHLWSRDCFEDCEALGGNGSCQVDPTLGAGCHCGGCDFETWDRTTDDHCFDARRLSVRTCVEGDRFEYIDCVAACQDTVGQDGVCATLLDEPGWGCACSAGDGCVPGTRDSCVDDDLIERCINEMFITESCQNWCQTVSGEDGWCSGFDDTCTCF